MNLARRATAEFLGTALLLAAVVGSGIMGQRLSGGNVAIALLANTLATGATLVAIILAFGPVSGAHSNPAVTLMDAWRGGLVWRDVPIYVMAQVAGAFSGVACADLMFSEPAFSASQHIRSGGAQLFSEFIATFGLLAVIWGCSRLRSSGGALRCWGLHHRSILVYRLNILCKSSGDTRACSHGHVRRHPARRCTRLHRGAVRRCTCRYSNLSLARSANPERCVIND